GQPLRHGRRRQRAARRGRPARALGGRAGLQYRARVRLAVRGGLVVTERETRRADVIVAGERIEAVLDPGAGAAEEEIAAHGLLVLPGVVDAHVHVNEPGRAEREGWRAATRGAAAGGVTTVAFMPRTRTRSPTPRASFGPRVGATRRRGSRRGRSPRRCAPSNASAGPHGSAARPSTSCTRRTQARSTRRHAAASPARG